MLVPVILCLISWNTKYTLSSVSKCVLLSDAIIQNVKLHVFISKLGPAAMTLFSFQKLDLGLILSLAVTQRSTDMETASARQF